MFKRLTFALACLTCLSRADDAQRQKVQTAKTEHIDYRADGVLRIKHSIGELTVEGWDQPAVEITIVKSTKADYDAKQTRIRAQGAGSSASHSTSGEQ